MATPITQQIEEITKKNPVAIFTLSSCGACNESKQMLNQEKIPYQATDVDKMSNQDEMKKCLQQQTGSTTFPQVFVGGKYVGGLDTLKQMMSSGKLKQEATKVGTQRTMGI